MTMVNLKCRDFKHPNFSSAEAQSFTKNNILCHCFWHTKWNNSNPKKTKEKVTEIHMKTQLFHYKTILEHGRPKIRRMLNSEFFSVSQVISESWEVFILHWRWIWHYCVTGYVTHRPLWFVCPVSSCTGARQFNYSEDKLARWRTQMPLYGFCFSSSGIWIWLAFDWFLLQSFSSCYVASLQEN